MRDRFASFFATGFGVGFVPLAPGTAGSLLGVVYWWGLTRISLWFAWPIALAVIVFAMWSAGVTANEMRKLDPPAVVIDELAAIPIALAGVPPVMWKVLLGFFFFRLFDVWKPPPVRQAQKFAGGMGIVLDDVFAAFYSCATTHVVLWFISRFRG
jgi:phosphatidylglycerophosphatase A